MNRVTTTPTHMPQAPMRAVLWRRLDVPGHDACVVEQVTNRDGIAGWRISGVAVFLSKRKPARLSYVVNCDSHWTTRNAVIDGFIGTQPIHSSIVRSVRGQWKLNGVPQPQLDGCDDLDIAFTPATNTIALSRLALTGVPETHHDSRAGASRARMTSSSMTSSRMTSARTPASHGANARTHTRGTLFRTGVTAHVRAAWFNPEANEFSVLEQSYQKISRHEYRYHSPRFNFRAKLTVNSRNIVTNYPALWQSET